MIGTLGTVRSWSVKVLGYARDGQIVFERVGIYNDGKRYSCHPSMFQPISYDEDEDEEGR